MRSLSLFFIGGALCVSNLLKPCEVQSAPYRFKGGNEVDWENASAWNPDGSSFPDKGDDVSFLSAGSSRVFLPSVPIRIGTLVVGGGVQQTISGGTLEVGGGLSFGPPAGGAVLEFVGVRGVVKAPITGEDTNLIRINGGRIKFEGESSYSGRFEFKGGAVGVIGQGKYPLGETSFAKVIVDGGTLSADGLNRSIDNHIQFGGTAEAGGTVRLGELGAGSLIISSVYPVQLGSGGTYRVVVIGTSVISAGIAGPPGNSVDPTSSVIKQGLGSLVMGGQFSQVAAVTVEEGTLDLRAQDNIIAGGTLIMSGGTLLLGDSQQLVSGLVIHGGLIQSGENQAPQIFVTDTMWSGRKIINADVDTTATVNASILDDAATPTKLVKTGQGLLSLNRYNAFSSGVELIAGILEVGALDALGVETLSWSGGTLRAGLSAQEIANPVLIQSESALRLGGQASGTLTFSGNFNLGTKGVLDVVSDTVFAGDVSGGSLEMVGSGRLILSGTTTFSGHTRVTNGTFEAGSGGLSKTSRIDVVGARLGLVNYNPTAPMRVSGGGVVQFAGSHVGSGMITLEGGVIRGDGVQVSRPIEVRGGGENVIQGGPSRFLIGDTTVQPSGILMVKGSVEMNSLALSSGGGLIIPDGMTLTTGGLSAGSGSRLTWDLRSPGVTAIRVSGNSPVDVSGMIVEVPDASLAELMNQVLPSNGEALVAPGKSEVVRTLIDGNGVITEPQGFEMGSATLRFRLRNQSGDVVMVVDRKTLSEVIKSSRSSAFLAVLDAVNSRDNPSAAPAAAALGQPVAATLAQQPVAAAGAQPTPLVSFLRAIEQLQSVDQIRALLSPLDGGRGYADLTATYGLQGLALSGPLDAHLDGIASDGFTDSAVSLGVNVQPTAPATNEDAKFLRSSASSDPRSSAWVAGYGVSSRLDSNAVRDYSGVNASGGGSVFGLERRYGDLRVGGIVVVGQASSRVKEPDVRLEAEHWNVGGYGSVRFGRVTVDSSALFGMSSLESERPLLGQMAKADFKAKDLQLALGLTLNLAAQDSRWEISPVFRLKYLRSDQDGFQEQGSIAPLTGEPIVIDRLFSRVGLRLGRHGQVSQNFGLGFFGAAYWLHDFTPQGNEMAFRLAGVPYRTRARDVDADMMQLNMGIQASIYRSWTLNLAGQRDMGAQRTQQTGMVSVGFRF